MMSFRISFHHSFDYIENRYFDMVKIFGGAGFEKIKNMKIFLVGSGSIVCENIKNFDMSELCTSGKLIATDMDSIEQSNLNRQFLFREEDVMKMKSDSAVKNAGLLNEDFSSALPIHSSSVDFQNISSDDKKTNLISYTLAVKNDTENTFSNTFYSVLDLISNALDNVEARLYMDRRCVQMRKPLVDTDHLKFLTSVKMSLDKINKILANSSYKIF